MTAPTRRQMLNGFAASGVTIGVGPLGIPRIASAADDALHMLTWGWGYDKAINAAVIPRFKSGPVELEIGTNAANYAKLLAQRANPVMSGGIFNTIFSYRGVGDKMWAKLDKSLIPNAKNFPDWAFLETNGLAINVQPYGIVYNPKLMDRPKSSLDLFDPKFKGKIGLSDYYFDGFSLTAKAMGKSIDDVETGIKAWSEHKTNIGPWNQSPAQLHDLIESGELWAAFSFGGSAGGAIASGKKIEFTIPQEGATAVIDVAHSIAGFDQKTTARAQQFLGLLADDEAQLAFSRNVFTSPVSRSAQLPPELATNPGILSAERAAALYRLDFELSAKKYGEYKSQVNQLLKA